MAKMAGADFGRDVLHGGTLTTAGDMQFIKAGNISDNDPDADGDALLVAQLPGLEERPWDIIQELASLGDADGNPYRAWVDTGRLLHYQPIDTTPRYYIRQGNYYDTMAGRAPVNPWLMQPAVARDMDYRPTATEPGSFLDNPRDLYCEEIEMADGWAVPAVKTVLFSEAELLQSRMERGGA
jgi:hypothetical protein